MMKARSVQRPRGVENHDSVVHQVHQSHPGHRPLGGLSV